MHYKLYEEDHDKDYNPESDSGSEYETESEGMRTINPFLSRDVIFKNLN